MTQFDRQYRLAIGPPGKSGFEVGEIPPGKASALHISFNVSKADTETPNTATISLWNLNPEHLAIINTPNAIVALRAGYGTHIPLAFAGAITYTETSMDEGDRETRIEAVDGMVALRDVFVSMSYSGKINNKKIISDVAVEMGVAVTFSYNAPFTDLPTGFSYVGAAKGALDKACASSGLQWQLHNGTLQVKRKGDTMSREVYVLSSDSGLIGIPKKITFAAGGNYPDEQSGWEVQYLLNGAIGIGDYIRLESKYVKGYFQPRSIELGGDNLEGDWLAVAKLVDAV